MVQWLLCRLGWHDLEYVAPHWYGHPFGRCRRCRRIVVWNERQELQAERAHEQARPLR